LPEECKARTKVRVPNQLAKTFTTKEASLSESRCNKRGGDKKVKGHATKKEKKGKFCHKVKSRSSDDRAAAKTECLMHRRSRGEEKRRRLRKDGLQKILGPTLRFSNSRAWTANWGAIDPLTGKKG